MVKSDLNILLVEDNEDDLFLMKRAIRSAGIVNPLHCIDDGQEALDYLVGNGKYSDRIAFPLPAVMFLDLKLPRKSGLEVLQSLRATFQQHALVVIVLTSSNQVRDMTKAYELGTNSYIVKPSSFEQLQDFMTAFKKYWLSYNQCVVTPCAA